MLKTQALVLQEMAQFEPPPVKHCFGWTLQYQTQEHCSCCF